MTVSWSSSTYNEFTIESQRFEELTWAAMGVQPRTDVLFCGYENSLPMIERALAIGANVSVVETDADAMRKAAGRGIETVRASTTNLPIRNDRYALAVAFHYLHEVDPTFHTQIVSELGRISRRLAIVEPGPPTDLLGSRIASLYSRAKRRLGQFEQYQQLEYWRRLLLGVRSFVSPTEIRYAHLPPKPFLHDTMQMVLESMKIAGATDEDLRGLRGLAEASDAQLVPQPRYILLAGITSADIPDRPRMAELQKQAPLRYSQRRKVGLPLPAPTPTQEIEAGVTYNPQVVAKKNRRRGLPAWLNGPPQAPIAAQRAGHPLLPPSAAHQPLGAPLAPVPFGAAAPEPQVFTTPSFGMPQAAPVENSIANLFSVPQMPGADALDWGEDSSSINLNY